MSIRHAPYEQCRCCNTARDSQLEVTAKMVRAAVGGMRRLFIMAVDDEPMPSYEQLARAALQSAHSQSGEINVECNPSRLDSPGRDDPYPSDHAMRAAVAIELMVACGGYATVAYGRAIQKEMDQFLKDQTT